MGNIFSNYEYDELMLSINSFAPTNKKFNYVVFQAPNEDDDDNAQRSNTTERFKITKIKKKKKNKKKANT